MLLQFQLDRTRLLTLTRRPGDPQARARAS